MKRRPLLAAGSTLLPTMLAGCSDMNPLAEDEPETYNQDEKDTLLIDEPVADWPDDLQRDDPINENFDRVFINQDDTIAVLMDVEISEDIETAENEMEKSRANAANDEDYPLADDAFIADDDESAWLTFRHRNALGHVLVVRDSGGQLVSDRNRASTYGESLFEHWKENA